MFAGGVGNKMGEFVVREEGLIGGVAILSAGGGAWRRHVTNFAGAEFIGVEAGLLLEFGGKGSEGKLLSFG